MVCTLKHLLSEWWTGAELGMGEGRILSYILSVSVSLGEYELLAKVVPASFCGLVTN